MNDDYKKNKGTMKNLKILFHDRSRMLTKQQKLMLYHHKG